MKLKAPDATRDSYFENVLIELKTLRAEENRLHHAYPKLRRSPKLMARFWSDLVALRKRAGRLDALLDSPSMASAAMGQLCA